VNIGISASPGAVSSSSDRVATIGRERVMAGSDCGFAQSPFTRRVHPTIQWAKLKAQAEGARIATGQRIGASGSQASEVAADLRVRLLRHVAADVRIT
jgi:hypothetical protein